MKLSEVNEGLSNWVGDTGSAMLKQVRNRYLPGGDRAEGQMTVADKAGKEKFINNFLGRAYGTLNSAIASGRVDPKLQSSSEQPTPPPEASAPAAAPAQPQKMDPKAAAALKGRLKAGQGMAKKTGTGFKDYVGGSGERMTGVDDSRAPIFKHIARESRYQKLNKIFESIINEDGPESISQFLSKWVNHYMSGTDLGDSTSMARINKLIQNVEKNYSKDKGKAAMIALANDLYAQSYASGSGSTAGQPSTTDQPAVDKAGTDQPAPDQDEGPSDTWGGKPAGTPAASPASPASPTSPSSAAGAAGAGSAGPANAKLTQINSVINKMTSAEAKDLATIVNQGLTRLAAVDRKSFADLMSKYKSGFDPSKSVAAKPTPTPTTK